MGIPDLRTGVIMGISTIPEVGGILAIFAELLWPNDQVDVVAELKQYVQEMMQQVLDQVALQKIRDDFVELNSLVKDYKEAPDTGKIEAELAIYHRSGGVEDTIKNYIGIQPQSMLPYLVASGTIRLQCLRDQVLYYDKFYGAGKKAPDSAWDRLNTSSDLWWNWVTTSRVQAMKWRDNIDVRHVPKTLGTVGEGPIAGGHEGSPEFWIVTDAHDSTFRREFDEEWIAIKCQDNRRWDLFKGDDGFASRLNKLTDAYQLWIYLNPAVMNHNSRGPNFSFTRMGDGFDHGDAFTQEGPYNQFGPMTRLNMWWDGGALKGLQVYYGGQDTGIVGTATGQTSSYDFREGEVISVIGGHANDYVERFYYNTNTRKAAGQGIIGPNGVPGDFAWQPDFHSQVEPGDVRVAYFTGINARSLGRITQLKIAWVKTADYDMQVADDQDVNVLVLK